MGLSSNCVLVLTWSTNASLLLICLKGSTVKSLPRPPGLSGFVHRRKTSSASASAMILLTVTQALPRQRLDNSSSLWVRWMNRPSTAATHNRTSAPSQDYIQEPVLFPSVRELTISHPLCPFDEERTTAIVELAKSHHASGRPFERVILRGGVCLWGWKRD